MKIRRTISSVFFFLIELRRAFALLLFMSAVGVFTHGQLPAPRSRNPNPWNGSWRLDVKRSSPAASEEGVPQMYRLTLGPDDSANVSIKWEIPELGEVVIGKTDGHPMAVVRSKPSPGLTLAVRADGPAALTYSVFQKGLLLGGGRMMLVDNGKAWVDLTWPGSRQDLASELVYVKEQ